MNQEYLNDYFANHWKPSLSAYKHSSYETIAKKIKDDEWLLDVGCGYNPFKKLVKNVVGIDPANDAADFKVTIEDYVAEQRFDVATCLGSINFGTEADIHRQITALCDWMKPKSRIYWRVNPGRQDHSSDLCKNIQFFPWSPELLKKFADLYLYRCENIQEETDGKVVRLYCEWYKD
jgi:hypothetical protein